jgi:hypothetical protein
MKKVRVNVPVTLTLPDATVALLEAAAPLVRTVSEHAPALRQLGAAGRVFVKEADKILKAERARKADAGPKARRRRV